MKSQQSSKRICPTGEILINNSMGVFGRKKKKEATKNDNGNLLDNYYYGDEGDSSFESSGGDSLPPPPPSYYPSSSSSSKPPTRSSHNPTDNNNDDEESPASPGEKTGEAPPIYADPYIEAIHNNDKNDDRSISVLYDDMVEKKWSSAANKDDYGYSNVRRNKILLIVACCVSFCVLVGLVAVYATVSMKDKQEQQQANAVAFVSESELNSNNNTTLEIVPTDTEEQQQQQQQDEDVAMKRFPEGAGEDNIFAHENNNIPPPPPVVGVQQETATGTTEGSIDPSNVSTQPIDTSSSSIGADIDTTVDGILSTDNDSEGKTAVPTLYASLGGNSDPDECAITQIVASSHCENGIASTSIFMCLGTDTPLSDQFWAWSEVPVAYKPYQERDWGWLADALAQFQERNHYGGQQYSAASPRTVNREVTGLPNGRYVLGLYADGNGPVLEQYPLLASSEFTIACGG